jgi:hypothetical protein
MAILLAGIQTITIAGAEVKEITAKSSNKTMKLINLILGNNDTNDVDENFDPFAENKPKYETTLGIFFFDFKPDTKISDYDQVSKSRVQRIATRYDHFIVFRTYLSIILTALAPDSYSTKISNLLSKDMNSELKPNLELMLQNPEAVAQLQAKVVASKKEWQNNPNSIMLNAVIDYINESDENYNYVIDLLAKSFVSAVNTLAEELLLRPVIVKLHRKKVEDNSGVLPSVSLNINYNKNDKLFIQPASSPLVLAYSNYEKGLDDKGQKLLDAKAFDRSSAVPHASTTLPEEQAAKQAATMSIDGAVAGLLA